MLPLVGFNFGANQKERVGEVVIKAGMISFLWGMFCWMIFMIFPAQVMSAFPWIEPDSLFLVLGAPLDTPTREPCGKFRWQ